MDITPVGSPEWIRWKDAQRLQPPQKRGKNQGRDGIAGAANGGGSTTTGPVVIAPRPVRPAASWNNPGTLSNGSGDSDTSSVPTPVQDANCTSLDILSTGSNHLYNKHIGGPGWSSATSSSAPAQGLTATPATESSADEDNFYPSLDTKTGTITINAPEFEDDDDDEGLVWGTPLIVMEMAGAESSSSAVPNLWEGLDPFVGEPKNKEEIICPTHGVTCRRGICIDYSRLKKQKEREMQAKEKEKARDTWRSNKPGKGRGRSRGDSGAFN